MQHPGLILVSKCMLVGCLFFCFSFIEKPTALENGTHHTAAIFLVFSAVHLTSAGNNTPVHLHLQCGPEACTVEHRHFQCGSEACTPSLPVRAEGLYSSPLALSVRSRHPHWHWECRPRTYTRGGGAGTVCSMVSERCLGATAAMTIGDERDVNFTRAGPPRFI